MLWFLQKDAAEISMTNVCKIRPWKFFLKLMKSFCFTISHIAGQHVPTKTYDCQVFRSMQRGVSVIGSHSNTIHGNCLWTVYWHPSSAPQVIFYILLSMQRKKYQSVKCLIRQQINKWSDSRQFPGTSSFLSETENQVTSEVKAGTAPILNCFQWT